jgi:hypothetical protein
MVSGIRLELGPGIAMSTVVNTGRDGFMLLTVVGALEPLNVEDPRCVAGDTVIYGDPAATLAFRGILEHGLAVLQAADQS